MNITIEMDRTGESITFFFIEVQSAPVCSGELTFIDVDTGETITLGDSDLMITENNITFTTQQLRENRHYNVTVTAFNTDCSTTFLVSISKILTTWFYVLY
jgi:hypothetical protein